MESVPMYQDAFYFYSAFQTVALMLLLKNRAGSDPYSLT